MDPGKNNEEEQQKQENNNDGNRFSHASRSLPLITPVNSSQSRSNHLPATQAFSDTGPITQPRPNTARPPTSNGDRPESAPMINGSLHDNSVSKKGCNGIQDLSSLENALNNAINNQEEILVYRASVTDEAPNDTLLKGGTSSPAGSGNTEYFDAEDDKEYEADYGSYDRRNPKRKMSLKKKSKELPNGTGTRSSTGSGGSEKYEDAEDGGPGSSNVDPNGTANSGPANSPRSKSKTTVTHLKIYKKGLERRKRIADRPNHSMSLWSILKNSLGKDLSKISMPVNFSEPLSMLQRLTEDYEYSNILDTAAACKDSTQQLCHVAAFTVSSYGTTAVRNAKPFNPLLGETFECDRTDDRGWRCISEQVSHHPPTAALYCEGNGWTCWQDFTMSSKFRGNSLEIVPLGIAHLKFTESGNHYTWRKVTTIVHNIVLGKLWVDQVGEMVIKNLKTGDTCQLKYHPTTYFGKHPKQVTGNVSTSRGIIKWHLIGSWDEKLMATPADTKTGDKVSDSKSAKTLSAFGGSSTLNLWNIKLPTPGADKYYDFTEFACQLNEPEVGVAPTDSRLRPDQRLMEDGRWDEANDEKCRLEEKQRAAKKKRDAETEKIQSSGGTQPEYEPIWFTREFDASTASKMYKYKEEYWDSKQNKDWKRCPNIF